MPQIPLNMTATAVFDDSGVARVSRGPRRAMEEWHIVSMVTSSETNPTQLRIYKNIESATWIVDSTDSGYRDTSDCDLILQSTDKLIFVWTGGPVGTTATIAFYGQLRV